MTITTTAATISAATAAWTTTTAALAALVVFLGFFNCPTLKHSLAGEADLTVLIDGCNHNGQFVAHVNNIFHFLDAFSIQLGDMNHTIHTGKDLHESAKVGHTDDLTSINSADLRGFGQALDTFAGNCFGFAIRRGNINGAVIIDVDLGACLFL